MISVGMDIHSDKTVCDFFDPTAEPKRQHRTATVPTTREGLESALRPFGARCRVFQGERMTAALLDRLTHRCHIFEMNGESYRFRESVKAKKGKQAG